MNDVVDTVSLSDDLSGSLCICMLMMLNFLVIIQLTYLQHALDKFSDWLHNRKLNLAPSKCEHLCITHLSNYSSSFYVNSHNIATVSVDKDLGIGLYVINNLKWFHHIALTFNIMLQFVLIKFCDLFLLKMFGFC